jgi:hypothetical protein
MQRFIKGLIKFLILIFVVLLLSGERIPMDRNRLIRSERIAGVFLILFGIFQTVKALINVGL